MKKGRIFSGLIVIILIAISFTGCFSDDDLERTNEDLDNRDEENLNDTKIFRIFCINSDDRSHKIELIIYGENLSIIENSNYTIEPDYSNDLYRKNLTEQLYFVKFIIDNNRTESISHSPQAAAGDQPESWIAFYLMDLDEVDLFIKHID
jgi:hypothetical protein